MGAFLSRLSLAEQVVIAFSAILAVFLIIDPLVVQATRLFDEETRNFFKSFTDLGKSAWMLIPLGLAVIGLHLFRRMEYRFRLSAAAGYGMQILGFLFVSVAGASLLGSLIKNIIGRARPKHFDTLGPIEFQPFTFDYDFASFPSGHATTICALAAALAILLPRWRVLLFTAAVWIAATRFLIGSHYFSDTAAGALLGFGFPYFLRQRLAARRWLFEADSEGRIVQRGKALWPWISEFTRVRALKPSGIDTDR